MDKELADVLAESREYIEEHGWVRGALLDGGRVCALGGVVLSQQWMRNGEIHPDHLGDVNIVSAAIIKAIMYPQIEVALPPTFVGQSLTFWNDNHAKDQQEVLDAFAKAEKIARAGYDPDAP